jgi:hypothetical protein
MKTQIIHRITLAIIAVFFAVSTNNGSNMYLSLKINCSVVHGADNSTKLIHATSDMKSTKCYCCLMIADHDMPMIPEPNGDHEFHSFGVKHHERHSFWKTVTSKIMLVVYYLVALIIYLPVKFLS